MIYETVQGDMWDVVSLKVYGSEKHTDTLIKANPSYVDTLIFSSGVQLVVPEKDNIEEFNDLPPWKRG